MNWRSHVLAWGDDHHGWTNADRFNILLANKDLRTRMLYELKRRQRGVITLPMKRGGASGRKRVTRKRERRNDRE